MSIRETMNVDPRWFETTLRSVGDAIIATDARGDVLFMNPVAERLTGWAAAEASKKPLAEVLVLCADAPRDADESPVDRLLRTGAMEGISWPTCLTRRDGVEICIDDSAAPIRSEDGALLGFVIVFRDATARRREEERQARLVNDLEIASRTKDEFLAMLGHELRNPLAPVLTMVEVVRRKAGDRLAHECDVIERQLTHMMRLVDDLMDASRIARGKVDLDRSVLDVSDVVAAGIEMVSPLLGRRRQALELSVAPELLVAGDRVRLAQVLSNLLNNAAKYSDEGESVSIEGYRDGGEVVLTVRDRGIGIESSRLSQIFELFVQEPQALDRARGGLGIGLAIARALVELHGGTLSAHSDGPGTGSAFTVRLPAVEGSSTDEEAGGDSAPPPGSPCRTRVLVVDDNVDAREALAAALPLLGYEPVTASDGPAAIEVASQTHPEVALVDIGLPDMDGYELARRLRTTDALGAIKLVALTGYGLLADRAKALAAGFDEHLVKPASLVTIQNAIERLL